jgi:hypothetical protein
MNDLSMPENIQKAIWAESPLRVALDPAPMHWDGGFPGDMPMLSIERWGANYMWCAAYWTDDSDDDYRELVGECLTLEEAKRAAEKAYFQLERIGAIQNRS